MHTFLRVHWFNQTRGHLPRPMPDTNLAAIHLGLVTDEQCFLANSSILGERGEISISKARVGPRIHEGATGRQHLGQCFVNT